MKMTADELNHKLQEHKQWLKDGTGKKLDLSYADLRGADLRGADLTRADFHCAKMNNINLSCADLLGADFRNADLGGSCLRGADLHGADLNYANLHIADLKGVNLFGANLHGAFMNGTCLNGSDLSYADLRGADLRYSMLHGADLDHAKLDDAYINCPISCPTHGEFIGWKKVGNAIIKLKILEDSKRLSATTNKCRCDKALVLAIENFDGTNGCVNEIVNNNYKPAITYKVGEIVYPDWFDENRWNECSHGIHFFVDRKSAVLY